MLDHQDKGSYCHYLLELSWWQYVYEIGCTKRGRRAQGRKHQPEYHTVCSSACLTDIETNIQASRLPHLSSNRTLAFLEEDATARRGHHARCNVDVLRSRTVPAELHVVVEEDVREDRLQLP